MRGCRRPPTAGGPGGATPTRDDDGGGGGGGGIEREHDLADVLPLVRPGRDRRSRRRRGDGEEGAVLDRVRMRGEIRRPRIVECHYRILLRQYETRRGMRVEE